MPPDKPGNLPSDRDMKPQLFALIAALSLASGAQAATHDLIIRNAMIYDGTGKAPFAGEIAIDGDRITGLAPRVSGKARKVIDAGGKAVSPGFINMLSWANESLIADGRGLSELKQGITLQVMGEGTFLPARLVAATPARPAGWGTSSMTSPGPASMTISPP